MSETKKERAAGEAAMNDDLHKFADADAASEKVHSKAAKEAADKTKSEADAKEKEAKARKTSIETGTFVQHEDGQLVAVSPEFLEDVDKTDKNWRRWRQVKAKDGVLLHHVGESDGEWTYREEP